MKKLYLHIGNHKTGTSSLQKVLYTNREILENNNFSFFNKDIDGKEKFGGDINLWVSAGPDVHSDIFSGIGGTIVNKDKLAVMLSREKCDNVIISIEHMSWIFNDGEILELKKELDKYFDTRVIVYIRRQDTQAISLRQQGAKNKNYPEGIYFGRSCKALPSGREHYDEYLNYEKRLSLWASVFGDERMIVRIFEKNCLIGGDVITDFLSVVGLSNVNLDLIRINESDGFEKTKVGMILNKYKINPYLESRIRSSLSNKNKLLPSQKEAVDFYSKYTKSNSALNKRFFLSSNNESIFNEDFSVYPNMSGDEWEEDTANQAIENILKSIEGLRTKDIIKYEVKLWVRNKLSQRNQKVIMAIIAFFRRLL